MKTVLKKLRLMSIGITLAFTIQSCGQKEKEFEDQTKDKAVIVNERPEYFLLRPEVEKAYGYSHAVKIGNTIKISGAVSFDDKGKPTAKGDLEQQMKNSYADLDKILKHYGCTFDDVVMENIFTTNMPLFLEVSGYRKEIYKKNFPTGSWLGVKELAFPELMIEIELEVYKAQ
ncbi:enamine deaminase RidA (YjgF/YER057c/UK114 family) [Flavobacterium sp. 90]|uniref:RidA family protein n=1 Tax=unclassified Flavobacterium TaxID=196869 RepID=UPI000EAD0FB5|nr:MULTISPECIES: RidA family protein [unclassified Flavobacterium]RKR05075.1 enamine deaminase RidA (YjgF/YER057c/UK114 family) [Flavobacterium sp. 81]TCK56391.1 enamine deaminase RidA (YjgF/YER057c/UK114 family) [Flavobacterium sp. 90]